MNYFDLHIGDAIKETQALDLVEKGIYWQLRLGYFHEEGPYADASEAYRQAGAKTAGERRACDYVLRKVFAFVEGEGFRHATWDSQVRAFQESRPAADKKREHERDRQERHRAKRAALFEELKRHGISAPWNVTTAELEAGVQRLRRRGAQPGEDLGTACEDLDLSRDESHDLSPDLSRVTPRLPIPHSPFPISQGLSAGGVLDVTGLAPRGDGIEGTARTAASAMLAAGLQDVDAAEVLLLVRDGITVLELSSAAEAAVKAGCGFRWAMKRARGKREDAARAGPLPPPAAAAPAPTPAPMRDPVLVKLDQDAEQAAPMPDEVRQLVAKWTGKR